VLAVLFEVNVKNIFLQFKAKAFKTIASSDPSFTAVDMIRA